MSLNIKDTLRSLIQRCPQILESGQVRAEQALFYYFDHLGFNKDHKQINAGGQQKYPG